MANDALTRLVCLVDFYNVRRGFRSQTDCSDCLRAIITTLVALVRARRPSVEEIEVRLYGGWRRSNQRPTRDAAWLLPAVQAARTRVDGIRVLPIMVTSLAVHPSQEIMGTLRRAGEGGMGDRMGQKMVDTMMTADAVFLARSPSFELAIWSDDDDLLPAVLSAARYISGDEFFWIRARSHGEAVNDGQLPSSIEIVPVNLEVGAL